MNVIETEIEGLEGVKTDVGWLVRGGIAAEMNVRQAYTVKHIRKALTLWGQGERKLLWQSSLTL